MTTPFTVIGGFLGAGKTTLLNHVLRHAGGVRYAVLVNDFGEIAVDDALVVDHGGDTVTFANGCLCCSLGDSLVDTVDRLLGADRPPEQFLVEASGVADPIAIADVATLHPELRRDLVVVLCDVASIRERAADARLADTVERQLDAADVLILNHCDRVARTTCDVVASWLEARTGHRPVSTVNAEFELEVLDATARPHRPHARSARGHAHHPFHTRVVRGTVARDVEDVARGLRGLGDSLVRAKGVLAQARDPGRRWLVQAVGDRVDIAPWTGDADDPALVLIAIEPLPAEAALAALLGLTGKVEEPGRHAAEPPSTSADCAVVRAGAGDRTP